MRMRRKFSWLVALCAALNYTYDDAGNLTRLTYPDTNKFATYEYDTHNRLARVVFTNYGSGNGLWVTNVYDLAGQLKEVRRGNGTRREFAHTDAGEISRVTEWASNGTTKIFESVFVHDAGGRITNEVRVPAPHSYTPSGYTAGYNADNEVSGLTNGGAVTVLHDANGNLRTNGSLVLRYDGRNRLTNTVNGSQTVRHRYDPAGQRISVTVNGTNESKWTFGGGQALVRQRADGTKTYYVHGLGLLAQWEEASGEVRWHHYDYQGSTVALTDSAGKLCDRFEYGPYGELAYRAGKTDTVFQFHGAHSVQTDANGLLHMGARYYSAQLCRFLTADPAGFSGGMNFYEFAAGNPISFVDPSGMGPQNVGFTWIDNALAPIRELQNEARIYGSPSGGGQVLSAALNMLPLVSTAKAVVEQYTGKDWVTKEWHHRSDFSLGSQAILGAIVLPTARAAGGSLSGFATTSGRAFPGPTVWTSRGPSFPYARFQVEASASRGTVQAAAVEVHETRHMIDFIAHPWQTWHARTYWPGASVSRYAMEYRAWKAEYLFRGWSPSLFAPLQSMFKGQVLADVGWLGVGAAGAYWLGKDR